MTDGPLSRRQALPLLSAVFLGACAAVIVDPMLGLPIAGAGLAGLAFGGRRFGSVVAGVMAGVLAYAGLYGLLLAFAGEPLAPGILAVYALLGAVSLVLVGPVAAALAARRPAMWTVAVVTVALTAIRVAVLGVDAAASGQALTAYVQSMLQEATAQMGLGDDVVARVAALWPSALVTVSWFTALFVVTGVGMMGERLGVVVRRLPPLGAIDLDARVVILPIAAIALLAAGKLPLGSASALANAGSNLLMIARAVFFVQGLAAFGGLADRAKVPRPVRTIGYAVLGVTEMVVPSASVAGLADVWLNLRRMPRDGRVEGPAEADARQDRDDA